MTKEEKDFIERQLNIIQSKIDGNALNRYAMLLSVADLSKEVKGFLNRAVDIRHEELNPLSPLVVNGDIDDIID